MTALPELLGDWGVRDGPLYRRLAAAIAAAIETGQLARGTMLPPERSLALRLAIGRSTVVAAYELLRQGGVVQSRRGSGTWVAGARPHHQAAGMADALASAALGSPGHVIDLATAALGAPPALRGVIDGLRADEIDVLDTAGYYPVGLPLLRASLARYLTDTGLRTDPDQLLITTGDQQALWLLCSYLLRDGGEAAVEDPTSPGVLDVLRALPATIRTAPPLADPQGAGELAGVANRADVRLLYVMATLNPLGQVASRVARQELLVATSGVEHVIDDLSAMDLVFEAAPPPLAALDDSDRVISVGSMSKLFWGGLRIGFIRTTPTLVGRLARLKAQVDLGSSVLSQVVCARLLETVDETRRQRLQQLGHQLDHALAVLSRELPDVTIVRPVGGLSVWLQLPAGTGTGLADVASRFGVAVVPGSVLSHRGGADSGIRVVYARDAAAFEAGTARLGAAWRAYREQLSAGMDAPMTGPVVV